MSRDGPKPEFELTEIGTRDIVRCRQFVALEAETGDFTHYAGVSVSKILHAIGEDGGWLIEENGVVRSIALAPQFTNQLALLPLPLINQRAMNRGIQCLLQGVQLISALHRVSSPDKLAGIAIDFPSDRSPSPQAVRDFGLCAALPEAHETVVNLFADALRRFIVTPVLLPGVARELIDLLGKHFVRTDGSAGRAWTYCPPRYSPLREGHRWLLEQIAMGKLSVIGLTDLPDMRFG